MTSIDASVAVALTSPALLLLAPQRPARALRSGDAPALADVRRAGLRAGCRRRPRRRPRCASSARRTRVPRRCSAPATRSSSTAGTDARPAARPASTSSAASCTTVRRRSTASLARTSHTAGWVRIVAVNDDDGDRDGRRTPATASIAGDYLEPFVAPGCRRRRRATRRANPTSTHSGASSCGDEDRADAARRRLHADRSRQRPRRRAGQRASRSIRDLQRPRRAARRRRRGRGRVVGRRRRS